MSSVLDIYYLHYGKEELKWRRKHDAAKRITACLREIGAPFMFMIDEIDLMMYLFQDIVDTILLKTHGYYKHKRKTDKVWWGKSLGISVRQSILSDKESLRNVYSLVVLNDK